MILNIQASGNYPFSVNCLEAYFASFDEVGDVVILGVKMWFGDEATTWNSPHSTMRNYGNYPLCVIASFCRVEHRAIQRRTYAAPARGDTTPHMVYIPTMQLCY